MDEENYDDQARLARRLLRMCQERSIMVGIAESCTGGLVTAALTAIPGSSRVVAGGLVTYGNAAKESLLGVEPEMLARHGAVSGEVACAMAEGMLDRLSIGLALSVTGIAGPDGGSAEKPVGLVFIGGARRGSAVKIRRELLGGSRIMIRRRAICVVMALGCELLASEA